MTLVPAPPIRRQLLRVRDEKRIAAGRGQAERFEQREARGGEEGFALNGRDVGDVGDGDDGGVTAQEEVEGFVGLDVGREGGEVGVEVCGGRGDGGERVDGFGGWGNGGEEGEGGGRRLEGLEGGLEVRGCCGG